MLSKRINCYWCERRKAKQKNIVVKYSLHDSIWHTRTAETSLQSVLDTNRVYVMHELRVNGKPACPDHIAF